MLKSTRGPPQSKKDMLILIDLQAELVDMLTYRHGPVSQGISRVEELICFSKRLGIPIALVTSVNWPAVIPSILDASGPGTPVFTKKRPSAFSDDNFARHVKELSPENLIIGGSIRHLCAKRTAIDALGNGYGVISTDWILFGSTDVDTPASIAEALRFYSQNTRFFPSLGSMEAALSPG